MIRAKSVRLNVSPGRQLRLNGLCDGQAGIKHSPAMETGLYYVPIHRQAE